MTSILTVTLNPALDLATRADHFVHGSKIRCESMLRHAGGGGINVARVLHRLGSDVLAWYLSGGYSGQCLQRLLAEEGVPFLVQPIMDLTRENFTVMETSSGQEFRFVLPGPFVQEQEWQAGLKQIASMRSNPRWVIASGSLPPGVPDDFYVQLILQADSECRFIVDTSGPALSTTLEQGVYMVKPSLRELRELTGRPLETETQWCDAAQTLVAQGRAQVVALSMGGDGALLATQQGMWRAAALPMPPGRGTAGAGDSFLATLVWSLDRGDTAPEALRQAVAAGGAALLRQGTQLAMAEDIDRLKEQVEIRTCQ